VANWIVSSPSLLAGIAAVLGLAAGIAAVYLFYRKKFGDVRKKSRAMIEEAKKEAQLIKKEADLERKDLILKAKTELEKETRQRRSELNVIEKRLLSKEEVLEKKYLSLEKKENNFRQKEDRIFERENELGKIRQQLEGNLEESKRQLLNVSRLTEEEARGRVIRMIERELEVERATMIRKKEAETKLIAEKKARNIIVLSIQRQAIDQCQEHSTRLLPIPNDEMKGRIIGRDGRNIRAFEHACGVDLIVDDTPDAILVSCFDPVRKHIAKAALEKLLVDGRIHPARIEEVVNKVRKDTGIAIRDAGENAILELGLSNVHPELVKLIGMLQFRFSYGQQQLKHSMEVSQLAGLMAGELGVPVKMAKRAGLLHDIGKAVTHEIEGSHAMIGADLCKKYGESADIEHAVRSHHQDIEPRTVLAFLIDAADAMSGGRPGARSKTEANYIERLEKLEEICMSYKGVQRSYAVQAGRDVRVLVDPQKISDDQAILLARDITQRITDEIQFPGQIKVNVIREYRAVEFAQ
jgi:ribonuclease Y